MKKILDILETQMKTPLSYGCFHVMWLVATLAVIVLLIVIKRRNDEKQLKFVLGIYSVVALILEALKQLIWAVDYDAITKSFVWDYEWYAFPFQLCTMPIYICLLCLFFRKGRLRDSLLAFIAYVTILGSIASAVMPNSLFVSDALVNIHAMWLHLGSLAVSIYLLITMEVPTDRTSFKRAIGVFIAIVVIANILNIWVYNSEILKGETFNMLYISPYFESTLPIFSSIYSNVPYPLFLIIYIFAVSLGAYIIYSVAYAISKIREKFI